MVYKDESGVSEGLLQESSYISQEMKTDFMDLRAMKWTLIPSWIPVTCIVLVYLFIVYVAGPRFMKSRQPYSLFTFMQCYNIFQIVANFWLMYNIVLYGKPFAVVWRYCNSFDKLYGHNTEWQLEIIWWILLLKIFDFIETIVFVLRKKQHQVSNLHVYHHISTVYYIWMILRYLTHGYIMYASILNTFVHVIMYSYYFLTACGPKMQQRIAPFKKWLTIIQMVQLLLITLMSLQGLAINCDVKGKYLGVISFFNGIINISFFWNFYKSSYKKSKTA